MYANDGTAYGNLDGGGKIGGGQFFDGVDDKIACGTDSSLNLPGTLTAEAWINPDALSGARTMASKVMAFYFKLSNDSICFTTPSILDHTSAKANLPIGAWSHVAVSFVPETTGGCRFYKNGAFFDAKNASRIAGNNNVLNIGYNGSAEWFDGGIDELRISNVARSADWMKASYQTAGENSTFTSYGDATSNLSPSIANPSAAGITDATADIVASLTSTGGASTVVYAFWGVADGGTSPSSWDSSADLGMQAQVGSVTHNITGLLPKTDYHFTFMASNEHASVWTVPSGAFRTLGSPVISTTPADSINNREAQVNGSLDDGGPSNVKIAWGTNPLALASTNDLGMVQPGAFSFLLTGLDPATTYHYKVLALNAYGASESAVASFTTAADTTMVVSDAAHLNLEAGITRLEATVSGAEPGVEVTFFLGASDGGLNPSAWADSFAGIADGTGGYYIVASNLLYGVEYAWRVRAVDSTGISWAPATSFFYSAAPVLEIGAVQTAKSVGADGADFSPAENNLVAGVVPTIVGNASAGADSSGGPELLTDGVSSQNHQRLYTVGNNTEMTFPLGDSPDGYDVTGVNLYTYWGSMYRNNITVVKMSYSTVDDPGMFVDIPNTAVSHILNSLNLWAKLFVDEGKAIATRAHSLRITFGPQESNYVGYREIEVTGYACGNVIGAPFHVKNGEAGNFAADSVEVASTVDSRGSASSLYVHWGKTDGGNNSAAWQHSMLVGDYTDQGQVEAIAALTGLAANTDYFFTFELRNALTNAWAFNDVGSFRTWGAPSVSASAATLVADLSATFNGELTDGGEAAVWFEWWGDGSTVTNTVDAGTILVGSFSERAEGLSASGLHHYRAVASNEWGMAYSGVFTFTTIPESDIWQSAASGTWDDPATWTPSSVPRAGGTVTIVSGHNVTLNIATASLASLAVASGGTLTFTGWDSVLNADTVAVSGKLTHAANSAVATVGGVWVPDARVNIACVDFTLAAGATVDGIGRGFSGAKPFDDAGYGPGRGLGYALAASYGGKGGYPKGSATFPESGPVYGTANQPEMPGSGGGRGDSGTIGGSGGGAMRIAATGVVTINGTVSMDGTVGSGNHQTGGSGGAIWITCSRLDGTGVMSASGGNGRMAAGGGGGGRIAVHYNAAVQGSVPLPRVKMTTVGGTCTWDSSYPLYPGTLMGKMGTLWFPDHQFLTRLQDEGGSFLHAGQWVTEPQMTGLDWTGDFVIEDGGLEFLAPGFEFNVSGNLVATGHDQWENQIKFAGGPLTVGGSLSATNVLFDLQNSSIAAAGDVSLSGGIVYLRTDATMHPNLNSGGVLTLAAKSQLHAWSGPTNAVMPEYGALVSVPGAMSVTGNSWVYPYSNPTNGGSAWFHVGSLTVSSDSGFNAANKGYRGGDKLQHPHGWGPGGGGFVGVVDWKGGGFGGGYGGAGGYARNGFSLANGFAVAPFGPGSGSGRGDGDGSTGGGAIRIRSTGPVVMNGTLNADGAIGIPNWGGGASGGAIWVICQGFSGESTAVMTAKGGNGVNGNYNGGGGGRIAVWHKIADGMEHIADELYVGDTRHARLSDTHAAYLGTTSVTNGTFNVDRSVPPPEPGTLVFVEIPPPSSTMLLLR